MSEPIITRADDVRVPNMVRLAVNVEQRAVNEEAREVLHVISTSETDRAGDTVVPAGAVLDSYKRNPVVLADHNYSIDKIIGVATEINVEKKKIIARTKFDTEGIGARAWGLVRRGMARAWSIGFRPLKHQAIYQEGENGSRKLTGVRFDEWEMLEYSLVAIPMNPGAVGASIARGLVTPDDSGLLYKVSESTPEAPSTEAPDTAKVATVESDGDARTRLALEYAIGRFADQAEARRLSEHMKELNHGR